VHHQYGPKTLAGTAAIAFLDSCVERAVEAVHAAGTSERTTFIVVSDHGFKRHTKQIAPSVALAAAGLSGKVYVLPEGGTAYVYFDRSRTAELAPRVIQALEGAEGIDRIIGPDGFAALGLAQPDSHGSLVTHKRFDSSTSLSQNFQYRLPAISLPDAPLPPLIFIGVANSPFQKP
jgi:hypothetical protein